MKIRAAHRARVADRSQATKAGLRKIQHQPALIEGCLAGTGFSLEPDEATS